MALRAQLNALILEAVCASDEVAGALEFLMRARECAIPVYLISATPQQQLEQVLENRALNTYFTAWYGAPHKKAETIRKILEKEELSVADAFYVGDSLSDQSAAVETGVAFVGRRRDVSFKEPKLVEVADWQEMMNLITLQECEICFQTKELVV